MYIKQNILTIQHIYAIIYEATLSLKLLNYGGELNNILNATMEAYAQILGCLLPVKQTWSLG